MSTSPPSADARPPWPTLTAYAIAMGFLEAAVVVYLRELYHPGGFHFPLRPIPPRMAVTELSREAATVVMIWAVARLAGGGRRERFAAFAYIFGIWDIFYYVFLKAIIGWPAGLLDPDILFLIPAPWVGPVLAPALVSLLLITLAFVLRPLDPFHGPPVPPGRIEWILFLAGAALVVWTFVEPNIRTASLDAPVVYPGHYRWTLFGAGWGLGATATARLVWRDRRRRPDAG